MELNQDMLATLALHAAAIAAFIRGIVGLLKSPLLGLLWGKIPKPVRPLVLAVLAAIAAVFDALALGTPLPQAIFQALGGLMGAITSHEVVASVRSPRKKT